MTSVLLESENNANVTPEDEVGEYLRQIRRYPLLTPEQERDLAEACARGDEEAIRTMVNSNLRLVVNIAREYAGRGVPLLDLIQEGSIGLLIAARKFDYTLDYRFSTYATKWIRQGVTRCILNHAGLIRVPLHTMERMRKIMAVKAALQQETGEEPTAAQIARRCAETEEKTRELMALLPQICSLDAPAGENEETALQLLLGDIHAPQPQEELVRRELKQTMDMLLKQLTPRQQQVLRLRFGMVDGVCYTLQQIGQLLHISKERARQVEKQAISRLQKLGVGLGLEDFLK